MHWEHFSASAPHASPKWATTDRGWLYLAVNDHPDIERDSTPIRRYFVESSCLAAGNYLSYPSRGVHASAYLLRVSMGGSSSIERIPMERTNFDTPDQAAQAIEAAVRTRLAAIKKERKKERG